MQAIILAAGKGTRMGRRTKNVPKPLIEVSGITMIKRALENISSLGISKVIIVIGYKGKELVQYVGHAYKNITISYVENNDYEAKNNIYSVWLCRDHLTTDDSFIIEGDLIFEHDVIKDAANNEKNIIFVDTCSQWMNGTVVGFEENDLPYITKSKLSNNLSNKYKTANIYKFSKEFAKEVYVPLLQQEVKKGHFHLYYEDVISTQILRKHFKMHKIKESSKWYEVDNPVDLASATLLFPPEKKTYSSLVNSFGGYWRIHNIKDFYYLNNPYFPNETILSELKNVLEKLITNYPSGRKMVDDLASIIFNSKENHILVGNGASEIIATLLKVLKGKFGIFLPTFDEYRNRLKLSNIVCHELDAEDFKISINTSKQLAEKVDSIIIVNPNNPTGQTVNKNDLIVLLDYLKSNNKNLIVDESFADFSKENISLLEPPILEKYDNLYIIKSMGKSYGIPGLRMGVLLSSNKKNLSKMKRALPIWNVNSLAEYFLEVFPRFKNDFIDSCIKVQNEREYLYKELTGIQFFKVYKSEGNFLFCQILNNFRAKDLVLWVYKTYNILLKDCSGKIGIKNKQFIRIGIKDRPDNQMLINAIKQYFLQDKVRNFKC